MLKLLYKEIKLVANPAVYLVALMGGMLLIPSYPYIVVALFSYIGIQISFQVAIGYKDEKFSAMLPISRKQIVLSKFLLVWYIQALYMLSMIVFALISSLLVNKSGNQLALDANFAFFGEALIFFGIFNLVFLSGFFKSGHKVGLSLMLALVLAGVVGGIIEIVIAVVPVLKANLDSLQPATFKYQFIMLAIGLVCNVVTNCVGYKLAVKHYEKVVI